LIKILKNLIIYRDRIIYIKIGLIPVTIKGRLIIINFKFLLLGNNKAVLGMLYLQSYNLKINWIIEDVEI